MVLSPRPPTEYSESRKFTRKMIEPENRIVTLLMNTIIYEMSSSPEKQEDVNSFFFTNVTEKNKKLVRPGVCKPSFLG